MPATLRRFQQSGHLHFITFSCRRRAPLLKNGATRTLFLEVFEATRQRVGFDIYGYVVMPEHIHLIVSEPPHQPLSRAIQGLKQGLAWRIGKGRAPGPFWEPRYYDFNLISQRKLVEKLRYVHRNPITRELVSDPLDWEWSSFRRYATGEVGIVRLIGD
jgi:putative transposase